MRYSKAKGESVVLQDDALLDNRTYITLEYILVNTRLTSIAVNVDMLTCVGVVDD